MELASFQLRMTGGTSDQHEFQAYDGFIALAGAARALTLAANYVETGAIRQRGNYTGRHLVRALPMAPGSLIAQFKVLLTSGSAVDLGLAGEQVSSAQLLYGLVHRVISRNIGFSANPLNREVAALIERRPGDVEKLVGVSENPLERAHDSIGNGVENIEWFGGFNSLANLDRDSKAYIRSSIHDPEEHVDEFNITGFYGNSGHGSLWDASLGHNVAFDMDREALREYGRIFSWGLDQFTNHTGFRVRVVYSRVVAADGRPKRYKIHSADYGSQG